MKSTVLPLLALLIGTIALPAATPVEVKDLSINGGVQDGRAKLIIEAQLNGLAGDTRVLFATTLQQAIRLRRDRWDHEVTATLDILQGDPKELPLTLDGDGEILSVKGEQLLDWSVRRETNGARVLVLRPRRGDKPVAQLAVTIQAAREVRGWTNPVTPLTFTPPFPTLFNGHVRIDADPDLEVSATNHPGLIPIEPQFLPAVLRRDLTVEDPEPLAFRFLGSAYQLPLRVTLADPDARRVVLREARLQGRLSDTLAEFVFSGVARVRNPQGGALTVLSGNAALTSVETNAAWRVRFENGQYTLIFTNAGDFPVRVVFHAALVSTGGWNRVDFRVAPAAVEPVTLSGLAADTQFQFTGAARPERRGSDFASYLPADGSVRLAWKEARAETEGRLFYSAEMLGQISIGPGLMRQIALLEGRVMQGELTRLVLTLRGPGNVTRVAGANLLAWNVEPGTNAAERRIVVQFNQPQKESFALQVQMQSELGTFPLAIEPMSLRPEGATRFAGHLRVANEGAVRLEVIQSSGLSQISPEKFPESDATRAWFGVPGGQRFAFRFAGGDSALRIQADNVLPEVGVSEVLAYHLGETELSIDAEFELDIREAPVRELILRVPRGFAIARLNAPGIADYFSSDVAAEPDAQLRLVYAQPVSGRQVIQLRLERNAALGAAAWVLPRLEVTKARTTRGHIGVSADAGFRLTTERSQALTEIATAFFPRKLAGIQAAFRLSEPNWSATLRVERLPQSIQAEVLHLFSIGEGIAYGSSTINYVISGAPISALRIELSAEYFNVEFTGRDIRNWQKTTNGYLVQLHAPVSGAYPLLATYERPFQAKGDTLTFTGARPLDAATESGHTIVISANQFQVKPVNVSAGLLPLETAEVPSEYRLFFDAPILAAYRYTARPFNLQLALTPLAQADTVSLVIDRAGLVTRISKDGEVLTDARYFVKSRGNTHLRLVVPANSQLWSVTLNSNTVVPVTDGPATLIPLQKLADPNLVQTLDLKLASRTKSGPRVTIDAPVLSAPILLSEWRVDPDAGQELNYLGGSLAPAGGVPDVSGFTTLARMFAGTGGGRFKLLFAAAGGLAVLALAAWRWARGAGAHRGSLRQVAGGIVGLAAFILMVATLLGLGSQSRDYHVDPPRQLTFLAPVQQAGSALSLQVDNHEAGMTLGVMVQRGWPVLLALGAWILALRPGAGAFRLPGLMLGWTLLAWAALRWPNGGWVFFLVLIAFATLHLALPSLNRLRNLPPAPTPEPPPAEGSSPAAALIVGGLLLLGAVPATAAAEAQPVPAGESGKVVTARRDTPMAGAVIEDIRVEGDFAFGTSRLRWAARKGDLLPFLSAPAVLTRLQYPTNTLKLVSALVGGRRVHQLLALQDGVVDIVAEFQLPTLRRDGEHGFNLPAHLGLVNQMNLTLVDLDVDVTAPLAVSVDRSTSGTNTVARLILPPVSDPWIGWKPRSRDVRREKAVFFAELVQLFVPAAGVVEGVQLVQIRPAQGEVGELIFDVPAGSTITDVTDAAPGSQNADNRGGRSAAPASSLVSLWRFDPDTRKLRVTLSPPPSRTFLLAVRSQIAASPLPFEQGFGLLSVNGAAGQVGSVGIATGSEVQLDAVTAAGFTPINLEDFASQPTAYLSGQIPGLTVRRAFRYTDPKLTATLKASAVEPDIRIETQETLSLGEDRTLLAATLSVAVTRAGIFRLSFPLPAGFDVESVSGGQLSHWTELASPSNRIVTLHLKGRTEGQSQFSVSLTGPGSRPATNWVVPRLAVREAGKQRGQLLIVPEHGLRLQVNTRDGVAQLDPQKSGVRQKGVLAFRILQQPWTITLSLEQVEAWVQVTGLQHATLTEALMKVTANLQYQVENTGLKILRVRIPTNAEGVRFRGEQVADFVPVPGAGPDGLQTWEIKLHRRIIGRYLLQVLFQSTLPAGATNVVVPGIQAVDVNVQRGYTTVESTGRLQVRPGAIPPALQTAEWQGIPRQLRQDLDSASASLTYRLVESAYQLPLILERHEATRLEPARVTAVTLTSVISDEGVMLTSARLELIPGDKRLLNFTLPAGASFWFAFVNQNGVWPWREQDRILVPLEQQSQPDRPVVVELLYSSEIGSPGRGSQPMRLQGPQFDLPLENITWRVFLNDKWHLARVGGTLQLQNETTVTTRAVDAEAYLMGEASRTRQKTQEAEQLLAFGNTLLEKGDPQQARRAFKSAYSLSTHDSAFNEDARVQLHNLKLQQALLGLNVLNGIAAGDNGAVAVNPEANQLRSRANNNYTQQEARKIINANNAEDNSVMMRLAERLIQQQDAAQASPTAIRASIPEQGRLITFRRSVQVGKFTDLKLDLETRTVRTVSGGARFLILAGVFAVLTVLAVVARRTARTA